MTTDRTFRIPADATGGHHTDPTGTIAHTGPRNGCGRCTASAATERQARREQISVLLARVSARKVLTYAESEALRFLTAAEQIDGDQAREQLAAAQARTEAPTVTRGVTCGEPGWAEQERARMEQLYTAAYSRAERAEATLTAVAKVAFDAEMPYSVRLSKIRNLIDAADQETALGDPQPATEPECADRIVAYQSIYRPGLIYCRPCADDVVALNPVTSGELPDGGICTACGTDVLIEPAEPECPCGTGGVGDYEGPVRDCPVHGEQPTEPLPERRPNCRCIVTVTPAQVRDAVRHIIREDRLRPGDVIR